MDNTDARRTLIEQTIKALMKRRGVVVLSGVETVKPSTKYPGASDIIGSYIWEHRGESVCRPFAFHAVPKGHSIEGRDDLWLWKLRAFGWVTAIITQPVDAIVALREAEGT